MKIYAGGNEKILVLFSWTTLLIYYLDEAWLAYRVVILILFYMWIDSKVTIHDTLPKF